MVRIMALDIGERTIGIAVSDPLGLTAQPVRTVRRRSLDADISELQVLVKEYQVEELVLGLPRHMDGRLGPEAEQVQQLGSLLLSRLGLKVSYWDERLTTVAAQKAMLEGDLSRRRRRLAVDRTAASLILQGYLERARQAGGKVDSRGSERIE